MEVLIVEISPRSIRECVEHEISMERGSNVSALKVLRSMRDSGDLTRREELSLESLENAIDQSSKLLYHTLSTALESQQQTLDCNCVRHGLHRHQRATVEGLVDFLYREDPTIAGDMKRRLFSDGPDSAQAFAALSEKTICACRDPQQLTEVTRLLTLDPKNSLLRELYDTAIATIDRVKDFATTLLRDRERLREGADIPSIAEKFEHRPTDRDTGAAFLLKSSDDGPDGVTKRIHGIEEMAKAVQHTVVERRIAELREKLEKLTQEIVRTHSLAVEGPEAGRYSASVECNQDQADANKVEKALKAAESEEKWFDA